MKGMRVKEIMKFIEALEENENWQVGKYWTDEELIIAYDKAIGKAETDMESCFAHAMAYGAFSREKGIPNYKYSEITHNNAKKKIQEIINRHDEKKPRPTNG